MEADSEQVSPLLVGLIADIQYADADDGSDFEGKEHRHFRNALNIVEAAVDAWNAQGVDVVVQLGDVIDGINSKANASEKSLSLVLQSLSKCKASRRLDLVGNHELYNFSREALRNGGLNFLGPDGHLYYSTDLNSHWAAVVLDPFEIALIGYPGDHPMHLEAVAVMEANNPNVLSGKGGNWYDGLSEDKKYFVPFNGGISARQLTWLRSALEKAQSLQQNVIVFSHIPLHMPATKSSTVAWNWQDALAVLHEYKDCVVAVIAGHDHDGGYAVDSAGLHHITMNSPLTAEPGNDCFAILECHKGWARFVGYGRACSISNTGAKGGFYPELILAKGFDNEPIF